MDTKNLCVLETTAKQGIIYEFVNLYAKFEIGEARRLMPMRQYANAPL